MVESMLESVLPRLLSRLVFNCVPQSLWWKATHCYYNEKRFVRVWRIHRHSLGYVKKDNNIKKHLFTVIIFSSVSMFLVLLHRPKSEDVSANEPVERSREAGEAAALVSRAKVLCRRKNSRVIKRHVCKVRFLIVRQDSWDSNHAVKRRVIVFTGPIVARRDYNVKFAWFWSSMQRNFHLLL